MKVWLWVYLGDLFFIYYCSQWVHVRSCANPFVALARKWRKWKLLLSFSVFSLCKKSRIAGRALVYSCTNKSQELSLPQQTCRQSWVPPHQSRELPLPRASRQGHLFALARTRSHSPQTYFFLVCFLLSFSSDLLSNIWPEMTLLINTAIFSLTWPMEGPYFFTLPPLQFPFSIGFLVPDLCCKSLPFCSAVSKALKQ